MWIWRQGAWGQPGIGGHPSPAFRTARSWANADPDSFWGPAIHYNTFLETYVILLNRTAHGDRDWDSEGIYITYNSDLSRPDRWTMLEKIVDGGDWYPQVIGVESGETDKRAGRVARLFLKGYSQWEIQFSGRPQITSVRIGCDDSYVIWLFGTGFGPAAYLDVRKPGTPTILASYGGRRVFHFRTPQTEGLSFRLSGAQQQRWLFDTGGLELRVVNPTAGSWSHPVILDSEFTECLSEPGRGAGVR
ncbi:MAG: hypothetical protein HY647_04450 [Acidobacteria bacterium]|nr:hypothetical protein [Acidobacteriota bacterium]